MQDGIVYFAVLPHKFQVIVIGQSLETRFNHSCKPLMVKFFHTHIGKELNKLDMMEKLSEDKKIDKR